MTRRTRRTQRRHGMPLVLFSLLVLALFVVAAVAWLLVHTGPAIGVGAIVAGAFYGGRRWERYRAGQAPAPEKVTARPPKQTTAPPRGPLTSGLDNRTRAADARARRNGWLPPIGAEADGDEPPPF